MIFFQRKPQVTPPKEDVELRKPRRPPRIREIPPPEKVKTSTEPIIIKSSPEKPKDLPVKPKEPIERVTRNSPRAEPRRLTLTVKASPTRPDRSPETRSQRARAEAEQLAEARRLALEEAQAAAETEATADKIEVIELSPEVKVIEKKVTEPKVIDTKPAEPKPETPNKEEYRESSRTTRQSAAREEISEPPPEIVITISPEPPKKPSPVIPKTRAPKPTSPDRHSHTSDTSAMSRRSSSSAVMKSAATTPRASPTRRLAREQGATPEPIAKRGKNIDRHLKYHMNFWDVAVISLWCANFKHNLRIDILRVFK